MRYHRELPKIFKLNQITISKSHNKYYVALSITYDTDAQEIKKENIHIDKCVGIDVNINDIALSNGELIQTYSKAINIEKDSKPFKRLQRKQSRRILKSKNKKLNYVLILQKHKVN